MLSATLAANGVLTVTGTSAADTISVTADSSTRLRVNDGVRSTRFIRSKVRSIVINAGNGADTVNIGNGIKQQITIRAGEGNDTVHGGSGREVIAGQDGDDQIFGGGGSDQVGGGNGNDIIDGGSGNDYLYGDAGDDVITGSTGNDVLGGDFEDALVFKGNQPMVAGNDNLNGGDGNDWLLGERRLLSSPFDPPPRTLAGDGLDTFTGGAGNDILDIGGDGDNISDLEPDDFVPNNEVLHFGGDDALHTHVILKIKVKSGAKYKNAIIPANIGYYRDFLAALHTHDTSGLIHYEAPLDSGNYPLFDFFVNAGISMDKYHVGRFIPPPGRKVTMVITRSAASSFVDGKWVTRGGTTLTSTKFGGFVPIGDAATGQIGSGPTHGDIIEIRVG